MGFSMQILALQLFNNKNRPYFRYFVNSVPVLAILDTGSEAPVWCAGENDFLKAYPCAIKQNWDAEISGFGIGAEKSLVYVIPNFELTDGTTTYRINSLHVAVCDHPLIGCDFVMSDTMFAKTKTVIKRIGNKWAEIHFEKDCYHCAVRRGAGTFNIVTFAQEEISD